MVLQQAVLQMVAIQWRSRPRMVPRHHQMHPCSRSCSSSRAGIMVLQQAALP